MIKFGVLHITRDEIQITKEILNSKWLTTGQNVLDFENKFKNTKIKILQLVFLLVLPHFICPCYL